MVHELHALNLHGVFPIVHSIFLGVEFKLCIRILRRALCDYSELKIMSSHLYPTMTALDNPQDVSRGHLPRTKLCCHLKRKLDGSDPLKLSIRRATQPIDQGFFVSYTDTKCRAVGLDLILNIL
jgi:hypothetical protein